MVCNHFVKYLPLSPFTLLFLWINFLLKIGKDFSQPIFFSYFIQSTNMSKYFLCVPQKELTLQIYEIFSKQQNNFDIFQKFFHSCCFFVTDNCITAKHSKLVCSSEIFFHFFSNLLYFKELHYTIFQLHTKKRGSTFFLSNVKPVGIYIVELNCVYPICCLTSDSIHLGE